MGHTSTGYLYPLYLGCGGREKTRTTYGAFAETEFECVDLPSALRGLQPDLVDNCLINLHACLHVH